MIKEKSLQHELSRWIVRSALVLVVFAGTSAGLIAFFETRDLQDDTLEEISRLVKAGQLDLSQPYQHSSKKKNKKWHHHNEETNVIIHEIGGNGHFTELPDNLNDGLQTLKIDHDHWRVLVFSQPNSARRFIVAQQTEQRNEIALNSALWVLIPVVAFVVLLLLIIHIIIRQQFKTLNTAAQQMNQQQGLTLNPIDAENMPLEVTPFIRSINALMQRVKQTMQKQQRFIADAAHELRTPIAALSLQAENLQKAKNTDDYQEREAQLKKGLQRLSLLVTQLLDLARLQSDHQEATQTVDFSQVVQEAIADLYPLAEANGVDLGMLKQEKNILVADQNGRLGQLVRNAISNAINYTPEQGVVDVSIYTQNNNAIFLVEDTGIGIPEDDLKEVMQPFYRVLANNQPGNGLGLAISQEIAQRLEGKIKLSNREKGGLSFRYHQPL